MDSENRETDTQKLEPAGPEELLAEIEEEVPAEPLKPQFSINTTLDAQVQLEASTTLQPKSMKYLNFVLYGLVGVMMIVLLWQFIVSKSTSNLLMMGILALMLVFMLYNRFVTPKKAMIRWEDNLRRQFGTNALHLTTEFFALSLSQTVVETGDVLVEGYSAIRDFRESEHLFLLKCGGRNWFFIEKEGFQIGQADAFRSFINAKIGGK